MLCLLIVYLDHFDGSYLDEKFLCVAKVFCSGFLLLRKVSNQLINADKFMGPITS